MNSRALFSYCLLLAPTVATQEPPERIAVSLDILTSAGGSTARAAELLDLAGGAHDPRRRGFNLQQAELTISGDLGREIAGTASLIASIDPVEGESIIELEEAVLTWRGLPGGLAVESGLFFTDIGPLNARHPHQRSWLNQPVIHTRLLGGEGMRGIGLRLRGSTAAADGWQWSIAGQNANGETMASFLANDELYEERGIGGRQFQAAEARSTGDLVWSARVGRRLDLGEHADGTLGASIAAGPNATGDGADTLLYGADVALRWFHDHDGHRHPFAAIEAEFLGRRFDTASQVDDLVPSAPIAIPATALDDWGGYLQVRRELVHGWFAGVRAEWSTGRGASYQAASQTFGRAFDPYRADRLRLSPLLTYDTASGARIRLQYDYDDTDWLAGSQHSVWLGFEILFGTHPTH